MVLSLKLFWAFATILDIALSAPTSSKHGDYVIHEKRNGQPQKWIRQSRANPTTILPIRIGLRQNNLEHAEKYIMDVSSPSSPNFGKHWSAEKVANTFAPGNETTDRVMEWLEESGIKRSEVTLSTGRNWIQFNATVLDAEQLLNTKYHVYQYQSKGYRIACDSYSLPKRVQSHVDFVMPTIQLDGLRPIANVHPALISEAPEGLTGLTGVENCSKLITIDCLRAIYNFPEGTTNHSGNQMGIVEWADYLYLPDLPVFFANFTNPRIPSGTVPEFLSIDGGRSANLSTDGVESALDIQTAYSIVYPQALRLYQVGDGVNVDSVGTFNIFLDALDGSYCTYKGGDAPYIDPAYPDPNIGGYTGPLQCGGAPLSNVFSFSYGQIEGALPRFYQQRQCYEWMKLGLQGVSMLFASGDSGVANRYNSGYENSCLDEHEDFVDINGTRFSPSFPATCPYITTVGGTDLLTKSIYGGEKAVASPDKSNHKLDYYSGGGFSNVFELPQYQAEAVTNYLTNYPPPYGDNVYNKSGNARGFPDVSSLGSKLATVFHGKAFGVGGTSASAPTVAAIVNLLNEVRLEAGKGPIGFLNPTFYANPDAFNDITVGSNPGCGTQGFQCQPGWDPVTGLGTPNFEKLKAIFLDLP